MSLGDEVLREVTQEATALDIWKKLEGLYMKKSLANRLYLKKRLYQLTMEEGKELRKHLDDFNKLILELNGVGVVLEEEDQAIILLSSLPKSYEHFVDTLLYGKHTLTMEEVKSTLNSKDTQRKNSVSQVIQPEALSARGRSLNRDSRQTKQRES